MSVSMSRSLYYPCTAFVCLFVFSTLFHTQISSSVSGSTTYMTLSQLRACLLSSQHCGLSLGNWSCSGLSLLLRRNMVLVVIGVSPAVLIFHFHILLVFVFSSVFCLVFLVVTLYFPFCTSSFLVFITHTHVSGFEVVSVYRFPQVSTPIPHQFCLVPVLS